MPGVITVAASAGEIAAWLVSTGTFSTLEEAIAYAPYWQTQFIASATSGISTATIPIVEGGAAQSLVSTTQTALQLAEGANLGATELTVKTTGTTLVKAGAGGSEYGFASLLGVDLGIVGAAVAPLLGVAIGAGMYESNPELWTKISQKLLPFCYPDTTVIPTWGEIIDGVWQTSVSKEVVDAVKEVFDEEEIGQSGGYSYDDLTTILDQPIVASNSYSRINYTSRGVAQSRVDSSFSGCLIAPVVFGSSTAGATQVYSIRTLIASQNPVAYEHIRQENLIDGTIRETDNTINLNYNWTYDNKKVYYVVGSATRIVPQSPVNVKANANPGEVDAWVVVYGNHTTGGYPDGTSHWTGNVPSELPTTTPAIADPQGTEIPRVPVSLPYSLPTEWSPGNPANSPDPTEQPDPTVTDDPETQIEPYIMPLPTPTEVTYPEPEPITQPQTDPSEPRAPTKTITLPPVISSILDPPPSGISPTPLLPTTDLPFASNVGLITVYHPSSSQLYSFERWLWVTYADATIDKIWNNPFDGVITLFELYCTPNDVGNRNIHCGFLDSGIDSPIISRYVEIDCGTLGIPEYYGNYLDYSPYTKAHIYLPFIGVQELNPDDIVGHCVNVTYRIDSYNGSCIAMITVAKVTNVNGEDVEYSNTMYQFSGNCSVELPLSGGSQASIKAGMMMADAQQAVGTAAIGANLLGAAGSILSGSIGGAAAGVGGAITSYANMEAQKLVSMLSGKSTVQKSGSFGASHGAMGIKNPFITITRPKQVRVPDYNELYGYPAHKMVTMGTLTGFVRCREVHVISATANDEEKSRIEQLLKSGVYME